MSEMREWGCRIPAPAAGDPAEARAFWESTIPPDYEPAGEPTLMRYQPNRAFPDAEDLFTMRGLVRLRA